jgi:hypothetical protein
LKTRNPRTKTNGRSVLTRTAVSFSIQWVGLASFGWFNWPLTSIQEPKLDREALQAGLHELLVSLFRKRPQLSYFQVRTVAEHKPSAKSLPFCLQGYHDIVTVLFLTLPPELQLVCIEKLSLHRLRDSMGLGLEPVLGLLRYPLMEYTLQSEFKI